MYFSDQRDDELCFETCSSLNTLISPFNNFEVLKLSNVECPYSLLAN